MFWIADAGEVLFQPTAVARTDVSLEIVCVVGNDIQNATPRVDFSNLRVNFGGRALQKEREFQRAAS